MAIPAAIRALPGVFCHNTHPLSVTEGRARIAAITRRDIDALTGLDGDQYDLRYFLDDPERIFSIEWGLAREPFIINPECILISGDKGGVQWKPFLRAGLVPLAHSHPYYDNGHRGRALPAAGVLWDTIAGVTQPQDLRGRMLVFPSCGDFAFAAAANLAVHTVYTPYTVALQPAGRTILNPNAPGGGAAHLSFRLQGVRWIDDGHYEATIIALAGAREFWTKPHVAVDGGGSSTIAL
jgi:hypothetical protein